MRRFSSEQRRSSGIDIAQDLLAALLLVEYAAACLEHDHDDQQNAEIQLHHERGRHVENEPGVEEIDGQRPDRSSDDTLHYNTIALLHST